MARTRAIALLVTVAALLGGAFHLWHSGNTQDAGLDQQASAGAGGPAALPVPAASAAARPTPEIRPGIEVRRLAFEHSPRRAGELDSAYQRRARVEDAFERFREETGIPDEKAQALLLLLYDYQQNMGEFHRAWDEASRQGYYIYQTFLYQAEGWRQSIHAEVSEGLRGLLTRDERRAWVHTVEPSNVWLTLRFEPLIHPVPLAE